MLLNISLSNFVFPDMIFSKTMLLNISLSNFVFPDMIFGNILIGPSS